MRFNSLIPQPEVGAFRYRPEGSPFTYTALGESQEPQDRDPRPPLPYQRMRPESSPAATVDSSGAILRLGDEIPTLPTLIPNDPSPQRR